MFVLNGHEMRFQAAEFLRAKSSEKREKEVATALSALEQIKEKRAEAARGGVVCVSARNQRTHKESTGTSRISFSLVFVSSQSAS